jgi:hypothetical protein
VCLGTRSGRCVQFHSLPRSGRHYSEPFLFHSNNQTTHSVNLTSLPSCGGGASGGVKSGVVLIGSLVSLHGQRTRSFVVENCVFSEPIHEQSLSGTDNSVFVTATHSLRSRHGRSFSPGDLKWLSNRLQLRVLPKLIVMDNDAYEQKNCRRRQEV